MYARPLDWTMVKPFDDLGEQPRVDFPARPHPDGADGGRLVAAQMPVDRLRTGLSPRLTPEDTAHVQLLADNLERLPPIVVHAESGVVIDGVHRLQAARLRGLRTVDVEIFEGSLHNAYVEAVRRNIAHGKPLTLNERSRAATKLLAMYPDWSDRRIAEVCGLAPRTVAVIRRYSSEENAQLRDMTHRTGRDGKKRPVDPAAVRRLVAKVIAASPHSSIREVACAAKTSQATVLDVKRRLARGEDPVPKGLHQSAPEPAPPPPPPPDSVPVARATSDNAMRATPGGATFADWFDSHAVTRAECDVHIHAIPLSRVYEIADEARRRSAEWAWFAEKVEDRARSRRRTVAISN